MREKLTIFLFGQHINGIITWQQTPHAGLSSSCAGGDILPEPASGPILTYISKIS